MRPSKNEQIDVIVELLHACDDPQFLDLIMTLLFKRVQKLPDASKSGLIETV